MRRGLTLVEVLAATIILAALAAACIPLLRAAGDHLAGRPAGGRLLDELGEVADRFVEEPGEFGVESIDELQPVEIAWPGEPGRGPIAVERLEAGPDADHAWLRFTVGSDQSDGSAVVLRWVPAKSVDESGGAP